MQTMEKNIGLAGKLSLCKISENSLDYFFCCFSADISSRIEHPCVSPRSSLAPRAKACSEKKVWMSPQKWESWALVTAAIFLGRSAFALSHVWGQEPLRKAGECHWTGVCGRLLPDEHFLSQLNTMAAFVSSCKHRRGQGGLSPIILAYWLPIRIIQRGPQFKYRVPTNTPVPTMRLTLDLSHVLIGF